MTPAQLTNDLLLAQLIVFGLLGLAIYITLIVLVWQVTRLWSGEVSTHTLTFTDLSGADECASSRADK
jgi:hypothetical protein